MRSIYTIYRLNMCIYLGILSAWKHLPEQSSNGLSEDCTIAEHWHGCTCSDQRCIQGEAYCFRKWGILLPFVWSYICRSRLNWMPKFKLMSLLHTYMDPNYAQISKIIAFLKSHHSAGQLLLSQHPKSLLSNWPLAVLPPPSLMVPKPHIPPLPPALDQDDYGQYQHFLDWSRL